MQGDSTLIRGVCLEQTVLGVGQSDIISYPSSADGSCCIHKSDVCIWCAALPRMKHQALSKLSCLLYVDVHVKQPAKQTGIEAANSAMCVSC